MTQDKLRIVVAGDVTVDWYTLPRAAEDDGDNWQLYSSQEHYALGGGALLLRDFICQATVETGDPVEVSGCRLPKDMRLLHPKEVLHSNARLDVFKKKQTKDHLAEEKIRVKDRLGYCGPRVPGQRPNPMAPTPNSQNADAIVLDDAGNGFRESQISWPKALHPTNSCLLIHKMSRPLTGNPLLEHIKRCPQARWVLIINANDLRGQEGVNISRALSWERTAKELVYQLQLSDKLQWLRECPYSYLVVLFDSDGALIKRAGEQGRATLVFDPRGLEGGFANKIDGSMIGIGARFTAAFTAKFIQDGERDVLSAVQAGLDSSRALLKAGFQQMGNHLVYPRQVIPLKKEMTKWGVCDVPPARDLNDPDPCFWRILEDQTQNTKLTLARSLVKEKEPKGFDNVPVGVFGKLETMDREEIESYGAIRELMVEYLKKGKGEKPLAFAVFGPPGAGKSFGVTQVLATIGDEALEDPLVFNVSQFQNYRDLVAAFHHMRDRVLAGKVPVAFFDEFDASLGQSPLGWLKYFLAPLQDGEFRDEADNYHLGKCIMVFAGGTRSSFRAFELNQAPGSTAANLPHPDPAFVEAKGPDFVSRLRGFINVLGPNPQDDNDRAFILRRAKLLRNFLQGKEDLLTSKKLLRIDEGVLRALLHASRYKHGARSLQAVIDMSRLTGRRRFDLACLPPRAQLEMHVDADEFLWLTERESFRSLVGGFTQNPFGLSARKLEKEFFWRVAALIHREYLRCTGQWKPGLNADEVFLALLPDIRNSNLDAAREIPDKLFSQGFAIRKATTGLTPDISDQVIDQLARLEHERWCKERRFQGWAYGPVKDAPNKKSPYLVAFDALPSDAQWLNRMSVLSLIVILHEIGLEVFHMSEVRVDIPPEAVEDLAKEAHNDYCRKRKAAGETVKKNPSLVDFAKLPDDLKEANRDQVRGLARHLKSIGFDLRIVEPGHTPTLLKLNKDDIEKLAKAEHTRWMWQKLMQGWTYAAGKKSLKRKTSPCLVPWDYLPKTEKDKDRQAMRNIPAILRKAGLEAYRP